LDLDGKGAFAEFDHIHISAEFLRHCTDEAEVLGGINGGDGQIDVGVGGELVRAEDGAKQIGFGDAVVMAVAIEPGENLRLEGKARLLLVLTTLSEDLIEEGGGVAHGDGVRWCSVRAIAPITMPKLRILPILPNVVVRRAMRVVRRR